ncbi:unnamed protein product [Ostreobium quekettii]|uniref:Peptidase S8/S53 domain-containing protein n=1 Tax=Ostreobium quekettii TaxID=121088 RepID=A0A8S1J5R4_9CHLO|nr:unnamed protein product [Ostreobium quekettii]
MGERLPFDLARWLASLLLVAGLRAPAECADAAGDEFRTPMIVVVKDAENLRQLREMCQLGTPGEAAGPGFYEGVTEQCLLADGQCKRVFTTSLKGVSGNFSDSDLDIINTCMHGGVKYIEADREVTRRKDEEFPDNKRPKPSIEHLMQTKNHALREAVANNRRRILRESKSFLGQEVDEEALLDQDSRWGEKTQYLHPALWNLDRVDQRELPLNGEYRYGYDKIVGTGHGVSVFILDSGVRASHDEFQPWGSGESRAQYGWDFVDDDSEAEDCEGHGTHVASTAIGRNVGIAKSATVVAIRVLNCKSTTSISTTIAGLEWVATYGKRPGVVGLSLGVEIEKLGKWSQALEDTVVSLVDDHGFVVVVAAGNYAIDSCYVAPANLPQTITVAGHNLENKFDNTSRGELEGIYPWTDTGSCVDIFAPSVDILGACGGAGRCKNLTDSAYTWNEGTSMAVPHVAGVAAMYLGEYPDASPAEVKEAIISHATVEKIDKDLMRPGTPNRLLYSQIFEQASAQP